MIKRGRYGGGQPWHRASLSQLGQSLPGCGSQHGGRYEGEGERSSVVTEGEGGTEVVGSRASLRKEGADRANSGTVVCPFPTPPVPITQIYPQFHLPVSSPPLPHIYPLPSLTLDAP